MTTPRVFETPAGAIEAYLVGPEGGVPLLFHHGTPGTGLPHEPLVEAATSRGLRWVAVTRPGYAGSARRRGRAVADCAVDAASVLDALDAERCLVAGWSGGGPHALACGALLPDRVSAVAVIAGVAPHDADGIDWAKGMGAENLAEFAAAQEGEAVLARFLETMAKELSAVEPDAIADALGDLVADVDRAAASGPFAQWLAASLRGAVRNGVDGWLDDDLAFVRPWGVDVASIRVPVAIWQGDVDRMVPWAHAPWLADHVPEAELRIEAGHGHLSLLAERFGVILDDLVRHA